VETYDVSCIEFKSDAETQRRLNDVSCADCERSDISNTRIFSSSHDNSHEFNYRESNRAHVP